MKKRILLFAGLMIAACLAWSQVVTTVTSSTVCTGTTTIDMPVKVSSFTAVGSISLKFSYVNSEITTPSVVYKDPGLEAWGNFSVNTSTAGTIIISAFDPDVTTPIDGLTLANGTTLFTLRFTIGTISNPAVLSFVENSQGTSCEYGGIGPNYTPFVDTPTGTYYINGTVTVVADPVAPGLTKNPSDATVCAGATLTVSTTSGSGGTGTIADEFRYSTNNGSNWSAWGTSTPSFTAVTGTSKIQSRRTATGTNCDESAYNEVSWNVVADPVAPAITKNPADANVCAGQTLTVSTSSGSGGTGTIADEYRYSTNDGGNWTAWGASVPSFAAVTGTNKIQSRRTATGTACNESTYNEVSWNVVADPVAPALTKVPATASVCDGETLTVTTSPGSGGTGTIAEEYRYSTNNGSNWSVWGTSVPSFAGVPGTSKIQSRRTATGTGCNESAYNEVSWTVNAKQKISGNFNYHRSSGDMPLMGADITVKLYKSSDDDHSELLGTDVTDVNGYYEFPAICPDCDYDLEVTSTHGTDGAINTTDAAQTNYWGPHPYLIEKVKFHAGDVADLDMFIGSTDAGRIQQNFVDGTSFDKAAWTFWRSGFSISGNPDVEDPEYTEYFPKVTLAVGSDVDADMYGLVTGDFNRSFNPNITKAASATLDLISAGNRFIGPEQEFDLPVIMMDAASIGAISLVLDFPTELVEVQQVTINGNGGQLDWSAKGNELRIGWHSSSPLEIESTEKLLTLSLKTTSAFIPGKSIRISLAETPLNELADQAYEVIGHAVLSAEVVEAAVNGIDEQGRENNVWFSCYPNPSQNYTIFTYSLPADGHVTLSLNNLMGKQAGLIVNEYQAAGNHMIRFNTGEMAAGIYSAVLRINSEGSEIVRTIKVINNR